MKTATSHERISMPATEEEQIRELDGLLQLGAPVLAGPGGKRVELPESIYRLLKSIVKNMEQGRTFTLVPEQTHLTTQKAADLLGVSRPHVVKLLDLGEIPSHKAGSHRRVYLTDVLEYAKNRDAKRKAILDELAREAFADGLYDDAQMPPGGEDE